MAELDDLSEINVKIRSLVETQLATGHPYLLSQLGIDLKDDVRILKAITRKSLAEYVLEIAGGEYMIVQTGMHNNVQALVRVVEAGNSVMHKNEKAQALVTYKEPRYNHRFWAAFSVPLVSGRRFLRLEDYAFQDLVERPEEGMLEIDQSFICPEGIPNRDEAIKNNVRKWAEQNNLSPERFHSRPSAKATASTHLTAGRSILEVIIATLDRKQLANTTLTLDVVADLLRKRV